MIDVEHLTRRLGDVVAVDDIFFTVRPGQVTGFLAQLVGTAMPASAQRFLPFNALQASVSVKRADELLSQRVALAFSIGYAVVAVVLDAVLLQWWDV